MEENELADDQQNDNDTSVMSSIQHEDFFETSERITHRQTTNTDYLQEEHAFSSQPQQLKQKGSTRFIRAKGGSKIPLQKIQEMTEEDRRQVMTLKQQESYNIVRYRRDNHHHSHLDSPTKHLDNHHLLNQFSADSQGEEERQCDDELGYTYYAKKLEKDLDTNDLLLDERKLRKLYNIVHKEKVPITSLSKLA